MRALVWSVLGIGLLVGLGVWVFLATHERVEQTEPVRPAEAAFRDRFLAAQRLLDKLDVDTRVIANLESEIKLTPGSVLILPAPRGAISAAALQRLLALPEQGMHLVIESEWAQARDPLLDALSVQRLALESDDGSDDWTPGWHEKSSSLERDSWRLVRATWVDGEALQVEMRGGEDLRYEGDVQWRMRAHKEQRALHFVRGAGRVSVVNDILFATNWRLGANDNAEFLWQLLNLGGKPDQVVFLQPQTAGLWGWLLTHAWRVLLVLAVLVAVWLWSLAPRFGPLRPDPEPVRRRLLDHLRASGRLLWSQGARTELGQAARQWVLDRLHREYPHLRLAAPIERSKFIMQRFGLSDVQAQSLQDGRATTELSRFVLVVRAASLLHGGLSRAAGRRHDPLYDATE